jgi:hypothetical protein
MGVPSAKPGGGVAEPRPAPGQSIAVIVGCAALVALAAFIGWRLAGTPDEAHEPARREAPRRPPTKTRAAHARAEETAPPKHAAGKNGVTVHDPARAFRGYTLFTVKPEPLALLVDMDGAVVHRWTSPVGQPDRAHPVPSQWSGWRAVRMLPNGDLVVLVDRKMLMRLDWSSRVVWTSELPVHHDVTVAPNGALYTLTEEARMVDVGGRQRLVRDHLVTIVNAADGRAGRPASLFDIVMKEGPLAEAIRSEVARKFRKLDRDGVAGLFGGKKKANAAEDDDDAVGAPRSPEVIERLEAAYETGAWKGDRFEELALLQLLPGRPSDILHADEVSALKAHPAGLWRDGDVLVSLRNLDLVAAIDLGAGVIRWQWGPGEVRGQSQPSSLDDGGLLVFDNGQSQTGEGSRGFSRLVDVDPATKKIRWTYEGKPPKSFNVPVEGGCQALPNGDVLAAASAGRIFEVARDGTIVWEYFLPRREDGRRRDVVFHAERIAPEVVEPLLRPAPAAP